MLFFRNILLINYKLNCNIIFPQINTINPLASRYAGAPALKYGDVHTVSPSPGEVKGLKGMQSNYYS